MQLALGIHQLKRVVAAVLRYPFQPLPILQNHLGCFVTQIEQLLTGLDNGLPDRGQRAAASHIAEVSPRTPALTENRMTLRATGLRTPINGLPRGGIPCNRICARRTRERMNESN